MLVTVYGYIQTTSEALPATPSEQRIHIHSGTHNPAGNWGEALPYYEHLRAPQSEAICKLIPIGFPHQVGTGLVVVVKERTVYTHIRIRSITSASYINHNTTNSTTTCTRSPRP